MKKLIDFLNECDHERTQEGFKFATADENENEFLIEVWGNFQYEEYWDDFHVDNSRHLCKLKKFDVIYVDYIINRNKVSYKDLDEYIIMPKHDYKTIENYINNELYYEI
jgi:hypothetical protein